MTAGSGLGKHPDVDQDTIAGTKCVDAVTFKTKSKVYIKVWASTLFWGASCKCWMFATAKYQVCLDDCPKAVDAK